VNKNFIQIILNETNNIGYFFLAGPGEIIELDFRDSFTIEPSIGCKHDHLEIRDGPYGYSVPAYYYCGNQFPPK